ncbi:hypothetical protein [Thaumasiovibrio subtropicus]|uniref:hypothetical protein n=1 Tax=Thaumasiovibrio subtropicus TaxID=1891207 RepID=UPI000B35AC03|nr:hypothetical protein [Thaumasiovibrio subtropicus]
MRNFAFVLALLCITSSVNALPEPEVGYGETTFDTHEATEALSLMSDALLSFNQMTNFASEELKNQVDHTGWEVQNIAFNNWSHYVHGTLLQQQLKIATLERQQATSPQDIERTQTNLEAAKSAYQDFINSAVIAD